ncbi:MAG: queuosine precursor transporter [Pseudomonadota bacterium]
MQNILEKNHIALTGTNGVNISKIFLYIIAAYITINMVALAVDYRYVAIGQLFFSGGALIFPITYFLADIITEIYGYKAARNVIFLNLACLLMFSLLTNIIINMPTPAFWHENNSFILVLGSSYRIFLVTIICAFAGSTLNIYILHKWKILWRSKYFIIRSFFSSISGEIINLTISMYILFFDKFPSHKLMEMILMAYAYRIVFMLFLAYPIYFLMLVIKKHEPNQLFPNFENSFNLTT